MLPPGTDGAALGRSDLRAVARRTAMPVHGEHRGLAGQPMSTVSIAASFLACLRCGPTATGWTDGRTSVTQVSRQYNPLAPLSASANWDDSPGACSEADMDDSRARRFSRPQRWDRARRLSSNTPIANRALFRGLPRQRQLACSVRVPAGLAAALIGEGVQRAPTAPTRIYINLWTRPGRRLGTCSAYNVLLG